MGRILRANQATADLLDLWLHIKSSQSEARATATLRSIEQKVSLLSDQPFLGKARYEYRAGLRSLPAPPYVIFYLPMEDGITVIRVVHGHRDIDTILEDDKPAE